MSGFYFEHKINITGNMLIYCNLNLILIRIIDNENNNLSGISMHIIIDGYNVLKQVVHEREISLAQRRAFINLLGKYAAKKNHYITVVFDGGPTSWPLQEKDHGVHIIYSGTKYSADEIIKKEFRKKLNALIVTSDNEIKRAAAALDIPTMNALEFYVKVKQEMETKVTIKDDKQLIKTTSEHNDFLDNLMQRYTGQEVIKADQESENRHSSSQKLSKKKRAYVQKLKKL